MTVAKLVSQKNQIGDVCSSKVEGGLGPSGRKKRLKQKKGKLSRSGHWVVRGCRRVHGKNPISESLINNLFNY